MPVILMTIFPPRLMLVAEIDIQTPHGFQAKPFVLALRSELLNLRKTGRLSDVLSEVKIKLLFGRSLAFIPLDGEEKQKVAMEEFETIIKSAMKRVNRKKSREYSLKLEEIRDNQLTLVTIQSQIKKAIRLGKYSALKLSPLDAYDAMIASKVLMNKLQKMRRDLGSFTPINCKVSYDLQKRLEGLPLLALWFFCVLLPLTATLAFHLCRFLLTQDK